MDTQRGVRTLPDTRHVEELETTFLNKAQEFSKRLEDMNEGLAEATEKLKEQAVHLFVLNNEALFMNSPALVDRIAELRVQLKAMRVDTGGLGLASCPQEKEE
jgi:aspartate/tyrosine/aromatic aminotransferase